MVASGLIDEELSSKWIESEELLVRKILWILALVLSLTITNRVKADSIDTFTFTSNGNSFIWQLPASPVLASGEIFPGSAFGFTNISVSENGGAPVIGSFFFFSTFSAGGLDLNFGPALPINSIGPQVYSGAESAPTFLLGTFQLTDYAVDDVNGLPATLVISTTPTPEPSVIAFLILGLLCLVAISSAKTKMIQTHSCNRGI